jgi:uncharacterized protein
MDPSLLFALIAIFLAAIVRGFSGFGFSLLSVTALSLVYPTAKIVPAIFLLEIAASLHLLPSIWKDIHWRSLLPLAIGCLIATPFGVWALASMDATLMQLFMSAFVLVAVALMWMGYALKTMPGPILSTIVGAASGLTNGAFGIGGPPVVLFYFSSPAGNIAGRASLIAFFLITDAIGLMNLAVYDLVTKDALWLAAMFLPALIAGVWLGSRSFTNADQDQFRKMVLVIMALLAIIGAAKALFI